MPLRIPRVKKVSKTFSQDSRFQMSLQEWRKNLQDQHINNYKEVSDIRNFESQIYEVSLFGKMAYLFKTYDLNFANANAVLAGIEGFEPKAVVLGGLNINELRKIAEGNIKYREAPKIYDKIEDVFAKEKMMKYFVEEMPNNTKHFKIPKFNVIYEADNTDRTIMYSDNFSAGYNTCVKKDQKLLFGTPDINLILEDLALRMDVKFLEHVFFDMIHLIREKSVEEKWLPLYDHKSLYRVLHSLTKLYYGDKLYDKVSLFNMSILKTSQRVFGETFFLVDNYLFQNLIKLTEEAIVPEYDQIFRTFMNEESFFNKEKKFRWLKRTSTKLFDSIKNDEERLRIKKMIDSSESSFNFKKKEEPLYKNIKNLNADEILEKYVILSHLISYEYRYYLHYGVNPFESTIFNQLISDKYGSRDQIIQKFDAINMKYKSELHKLQNHTIKQLRNYEKGGRNFLISIKEQEKLVDYRKNRGEFLFQVGLINKLKQNALILHILMMQIDKNIATRINQGISQTDILLHLKKFQEGYYTKENIELMMQLLAEANADLGLIKLPAQYEHTMPYVKTVFLKKLNDRLNEINKLKMEEERMFEVEGKQVKLQKDFLNEDAIEKMAKSSETEDNKNIYNTFGSMGDKDSTLNSLIFGDENANFGELPSDLHNKSPEELQKMGFEMIDSIDISSDATGEIEIDEKDEHKLENIQKLIESLDKKRTKSGAEK